MRTLHKLMILTALLMSGMLPGPAAAPVHAECDSALPGWHVLAPGFADGMCDLTNGVIFEWDYLMVHDAGGSFTGSLGIVVADPNRKLVGLMPSGGNAAVSGKFASGDVVVDYLPFGTDGYTASADTRQFYAEKGDGRFASIEPLEANGTDPQRLHWTGKTDKYEYDLMISGDWLERCDAYLDEFPLIHGDDVSGVDIYGLLDPIPDQWWTVDMHWMRTRVTGWIKNVATGELADIDGWGYRENSWGPWGFVFSGWDFGIASDAASGIQWSWQTYHHSDKMDYLDVSFYDNGELQAVRFNGDRGELGWYHPDWRYDNKAWQCTPLSSIVVGMNDEYIVEGEMIINDDQAAMLSDYTPITFTYFIQTLYPRYNVTIRRTAPPHEIVASFENVQGGGEFSAYRHCPNDICGPKSHSECLEWGETYSQDLPAGYGCWDFDVDGYTDCDGDCDNYNAAANPGTAEICDDGIDNDCDGAADMNDSDCAVICTEYRSTPADHVYAGRAYTYWYYVFARGSGDYIGKTYYWWDYTVHALSSSPGTYELGECR